MNGKEALFIVLISAMLLSGCVGGNPSNGAAPGGSNGTGGTGGLINPVQMTVTGGVILTMKDVVNADCKSGGDCVGIFLETNNPTSSSVNVEPWFNGLEKVVDADGKEYKTEECAFYEKIKFGDAILPGAKRDGYFCFKNAGSDMKVYFGFNDSTGKTATFSVPLSSIKKLTKSAEITMAGDNYKYAYGGSYYGALYCLSQVYGTIRNTGEAPIRVNLTQANISGGTITVDLAVGETKNFTIGNVERSNGGGDFFTSPTYTYPGPGCKFAGNVSEEGGIIWATASDSLGVAGELAKKGIEVSECGYYGIETWEEIEYVPYWGNTTVTKSKSIPKPCCSGSFCSWGVCKDGMCVQCGSTNQSCCETIGTFDGCRDNGLTKRDCVSGVCEEHSAF